MSIHLCSASQQRLVIALTTLSSTEIHMVPYKYTREAFLQFPTLTGESPKLNILVVTWALVNCLKYMHLHSGYALVLMHIFQANHSYPCYNYYILAVIQGIWALPDIHPYIHTVYMHSYKYIHTYIRLYIQKYKKKIGILNYSRFAFTRALVSC